MEYQAICDPESFGMDQNSSAGNSPLADGEKTDLGSRSDLTDEETNGKKPQANSNPNAGGRSQGQQTTPRKAGPQAQGQWRPMQPTGSPQGTAGGGISPGQPPQHRFAGKPRLQMAGGPGQNVGQQGQQGVGQGQGAWPGGTFYPRATRFPQPTTINLNNGQGIPQGAMGVGGYAQQGNQMTLGNPQGAYGGPRPMGMMPGGMGGGMGMQQGLEQLSKTNLYIRGLPPQTSDRDLLGMCGVFGNINSTKAIVDKQTNQCKGYGFVDFENPQAADRALKELSARGMLVQMAKVRNPQEQMQQLQDADPTNLYLANLSPYMTETDLEAMLQPYGRVVSTRVLRDNSHKSRGVGFARMETKDICDKVIEHLNGKLIAGSSEPLVVKFADSGNRRRMQNRDRQGWNRMEQHMGIGGYEHMGVGQNGLAGSMLTGIRYQVPQTAALAGYQPQWQPQYTILPQQMTQMMQGVEGQNAGYSMAQLAAQMSQMGLSSHYNAGPYSQYGYNQIYPAGMQMAGQGGQGEEGGPGGVPMEGVAHSNVNSMVTGQPPNMAVYTSYNQQK